MIIPFQILQFTLEHALKAQAGENRYSSTLSLILALDGFCDQLHAPVALPPGRRPSTHCTERWIAGEKTSSPPLGVHPRTVEPVVSRYTDAILAHNNNKKNNNEYDEVKVNIYLRNVCKYLPQYMAS
jgi:hypothetical protein